MRKVTILITLLVLSGIIFYVKFCRGVGDKQAHQAPIDLPLDIRRLEDELFVGKNLSDLSTFLKENPLLAQRFFAIETVEDEKRVAAQLYAMVQNSAIQALYREVKEKFKDFSWLEQQLESAFRHLKYYYPDFVVPQIVTLVTGMGVDLYLSPGLIVIGLDFFLGDGASVRPHMPDYMLRTYQPRYIVPKLVLLLAESLNAKDSADHTLLQDMLYQGKAYYFCKAMLPELPEADILEYTPQQLIDTEQHRAVVWEHFIDKELFYTTNHLIKKKYLGVRPFTSEIGPGCPGHIAGWLGWQIVKKYMKDHPATTLPQLMADGDMQALFMKAKYKP